MLREHTETFGADPTALQRVDGPVVVLQSVHQLQDGPDAADGGVYGGGADELRRQVGVEGQLDLCAHTNPFRHIRGVDGQNTLTVENARSEMMRLFFCVFFLQKSDLL